jgi:hypothetical protein
VLLILQTGVTAGSKFDVIIRNDTGGVAGTPVNHVVSTTVVFDSTWHHVAWVDDRGTAKLYVDGNLDPSNYNYTPVGTYSSTTTVIGALVRSAVAGQFSGQIDEVAVWERALTQAEVQQMMSSSIQTPVPPLPLAFVTQPASATRSLGDRVTFRSRAIGTRPNNLPAYYQWFKGGVAIDGATSNALTLSNLTMADSGNYSVQATNTAGNSLMSSVAVLSVLPDAPVNLPQGLVSYWPFDTLEGMEPNLYGPDLYSHNNMRLIYNGFIDQSAGMFNAGIAFNGTDQYGVRDGGFPIYNNLAFSVACWVNATGTGQSDRRFFSESSTNAPNQLFTLGSQATGLDGTVRVYIRDDGNVLRLDRSSTRVALDGTWHHVVWTETNGQAKLYIDGSLDESDFTYTRGVMTLNQTTLGAILRTTVGNYLAGGMDEVAVWNRVLSYTEIQSIRTNGIPAPEMAIPPTVTQSPVSLSRLTKSKANFSFLATGTGPLSQQWRKDGVDLPDQTNQTLQLNNIVLTDAGGYDVVVTNIAGSTTSLVATLTVTLRPPSPTELRVDFNNNGTDDVPANTETGFSSFSIPAFGVGPFAQSIGGADVTLTAVGTTMESRKRPAPVNAGSFTEERLLQDFVFTRDAADGQGMDVAVEFLEPNKVYKMSIWSYDNVSVTVNRVSDWTVNGLLVQSSWTFIGSTLPTDNNTYRFNFDATSDADGKILIQGRRNSAASGAINVFVNALEIIRREVTITSVMHNSFDETLLQFESINPDAPHHFQQKATLDSLWMPIPDAEVTFTAIEGRLISVTIAPNGANVRFIRVVEGP